MLQPTKAGGVLIFSYNKNKQILLTTKNIYTFDKIFFMIEQITVGRFAKKIGMTPQAVRYRLKYKRKIPGLKSSKIIAGNIVLTVDTVKMKQRCKD